MPELPEVETIKRGLDATIVGASIADVDVLHLKSFSADPQLIDELVIGATIIGLDRHAKVLVMHLSSGYSLMFHLKMTGQIVLVAAGGKRYAGGHPTPSMAGSLPDKSTKVVFVLGDGSMLYFNDQRIFGWIKLVATAEVVKDTLIARLGPEPLSEAFTLAGFAAILQRRARSPIKAVILDQSTVSGIGNIYADESLHLAKIHPALLAGDLTAPQVKRLHAAIIEIIGLGIKYGGTSFSSYVDALGGKGDYFENARVFKRQGLLCPVCGSTIYKTRVAGRGTHICPGCQKLPRSYGRVATQ